MAAFYWRPAPKPNAESRFFAFPFAGGSAAAFNGWQNHLPKNTEVLAAQYAGRGTRMAEAPMTSLADILDDAFQATRSLLDKPYVLFGHSMGALVVYELLLRIQHAGLPLPQHVFLSAKGAPGVEIHSKLLHQMDDVTLKEELTRMGGTPDELMRYPELMDLVLPILRADFQAIETWDCSRQKNIPIDASVIGGLDDHRVANEHLRPWCDYFSGNVDFHLFEGGHFYYKDNESLLFDYIQKRLEISR